MSLLLKLAECLVGSMHAFSHAQPSTAYAGRFLLLLGGAPLSSGPRIKQMCHCNDFRLPTMSLRLATWVARHTNFVWF